jgi:hypothetical protein
VAVVLLFGLQEVLYLLFTANFIDDWGMASLGQNVGQVWAITRNR